MPALFIVNVSLPPEVEKALDTRTSMGVIGDVQRYQQFQMGNAMMAAAQNPSGGAGAGIGLGAGMAMAHQMMGAGFAPAGAQPPPPPAPAGPVFHVTQNGQSQGPFALAQLASAIGQGQVSGSTLVWSPGMAGWTAAAEVPALASYFAAPPPPPPPPVPKR